MLSEHFTGTERLIMPHVAAGLSYDEIGKRIYRSEDTVKTHVGRMSRRLRNLFEPGIFGANRQTALASFYAWYVEGPSDGVMVPPHLSRERMVLVTYLPYGATNKDIAARHGKSALTVKSQLQREVFRAYGTGSNRATVAYSAARTRLCGRPFPSDKSLKHLFTGRLTPAMHQDLSHLSPALSVDLWPDCWMMLELERPHALPLALSRILGLEAFTVAQRRPAGVITDFQRQFQGKPWMPLLCRGWTIPQIAHRLGKDVEEVKSQVELALGRYDLGRLTELTHLAVLARPSS